MNEYKALSQEKWVNVEVSMRSIKFHEAIRADVPHS